MTQLIRQKTGRFILKQDEALYADNPGYRVVWTQALDEALKAGFRCRIDERKGKRIRTWYTHDIFAAAQLAHRADEATRDWLEKQQRRYEFLHELSRAKDSELLVPMPPGERLYPFQRAGIHYMLEAGSHINGDNPGLGKTVQVCGYVNYRTDIENWLVICPATLKLQWASFIIRFATRPWNIHLIGNTYRMSPEMKERLATAYRRHSLQASKEPPPVGKLAFGGTVSIVNYDQMHRHAEYFSGIPYELAVLDEGHKIKHSKARWTGATLKALEKTDTISILTGTPIPNAKPTEAWNALHLTQPSIWTVKSSFVLDYCNGDPNTAASPKMLNQLQERLRGTCMLRRTEEEVELQLPAMTENIMLLPAPRGVIETEQQALREHHKIVAAMKAELARVKEATDKKAIARASFRLKAMERGFGGPIETIRLETCRAKMPQCISLMAAAIEEGRKCCFAAHNREILETMRDAFGKQAVMLYGGMSGTQKQQALDSFEMNDSVRLFCASITMGVGYTINSATFMMIAQFPWLPGELTQMKKRFHRIGQTKPVEVVYPVLDGSLDAHMAQAIVAKQEVIDLSLDESMEQYFAALESGDPEQALVSLEEQGVDTADFVFTAEESTELGLKLLTPKEFTHGR